MLRNPIICVLTIALVAMCAGGCHLLGDGAPITEQSLLKAAVPDANAVTLDIYWVELPSFEDEAYQPDELWSEVRENHLSVELRSRLASNGLRAGVVATKVPDALLRLLDPNGEADVATVGVSKLQETGVRRRTRQLQPGDEIELNASPVIEEAPLLVSHQGRVSGKTYQGVQGVYVLKVDRAGDDSVAVRLLPEVRHGAQQLRFESDETGAFTRGALKRESETFADLAIEADLAAGEMLLVTNLPESTSRIGGLFHQRGEQRKAILVRIAQAPATRAFQLD